MPTVHREVETKYSADAAFEVPALTELLAGTGPGSGAVDGGTLLVEGEVVERQLSATYFDTADLLLAAAGLTLRRRTGGDDPGWHLKVPDGAGARSEVRLPLGRATRTAPAPLRRAVWARSKGAALLPVARIATHRTLRRLVDATGRVLVEVADDQVTGQRLLPLEGTGDAAGAATSWREIEVELVDGDGEVLAAVDTRLRERGLQVSASPSKVARVLGLDPGGPPVPRRRRLTVKSPAGEVILSHIGEQVEQLRAQDLPVRLDAPDSVHKMRVATRRLRSALGTFKSLFAAEVVRPLRGELKWLAGVLGAARDEEVMLDRMRRAVEAESEDLLLGPVTEGVEAELGQAYRSAHDQVLADLDGKRYQDLLAALDALLDEPPLTKRAAAAAGKVLSRLVARRHAAVRRLVEEASAKPAGTERDDLLHEARKAAKQARYAGESVSRVFGKDAAAFARAMEGVQEVLGEHHDSVVTCQRLRDLALHAPQAGAAFTYGRLHALEEARARQSQRHFEAVWTAAGKKSLHRWLR